MKPEIHPKYYPNARVVCACGHTWTTGATQPEIRVDVCSNCHPFYTGEQRIVDTAGRVDRFRMRLAQKREEKSPKKERKQKVMVIGPDEETRKPEQIVTELPTVDIAPTADAPSAELQGPEPQIGEPSAERESEREPEVRKRTVVEGSESELPMQLSAQAVLTEAVELPLDEDEKPRRRSTARKPRAEGSEKPTRKPRTRKTAEASAAAEAPSSEPAPTEGGGGA